VVRRGTPWTAPSSSTSVTCLRYRRTVDDR
jgi:hypothetical protein